MKIKAKKIDEKIAENYTKVKIGGIAEIRYGDNIIKCKNKWTRFFMSSIIVFIANQEAVAGTYTGMPYPSYAESIGMSYSVTARVGTDETTPTTPNMSDLVSKVDIAPNSVTRRATKEPDYSMYRQEYIFTWNPGTLPDICEGGDIDGKVGEFGVYLFTDDDTWESGTLNPSRATSNRYASNRIWVIPLGGADTRLSIRIASADGSFDAFEFYGSIDPLTFKWVFQVAMV